MKEEDFCPLPLNKGAGAKTDLHQSMLTILLVQTSTQSIKMDTEPRNQYRGAGKQDVQLETSSPDKRLKLGSRVIYAKA